MTSYLVVVNIVSHIQLKKSVIFIVINWSFYCHPLITTQTGIPALAGHPWPPTPW